MHDEFRIRVELEHDDAVRLLSSLEAIEHDGGRDASGSGHVVVSHEEGNVFLYADSNEDAVGARSAVERILSEKGVEDIEEKVSAWRWHPGEERWEDASLPLPSTDAERAAEHATLEELETQESIDAGYPEWEVRITLPTHHDARSFAERLQSEGIQVQRHWRHLTLGVNDEDEARELAERLRVEAPQGSTLDVEGAAWPMWVKLNEPARPFAVFGGLAQ